MCEVMDVLTNLIVLIISQYRHISNHHVVYLKLIQCYVTYILVNLRGIEIQQICMCGTRHYHFFKKHTRLF